MDICAGWATKKNFYTSRTTRLDTYKATNLLFRMTLQGKIILYTYPQNWTIKESIILLYKYMSYIFILFALSMIHFLQKNYILKKI